MEVELEIIFFFPTVYPREMASQTRKKNRTWFVFVHRELIG